MKAFYILKPDAIERPEVLQAYETIIASEEYIKNRNQYLIDSWVDLSCKLYEPINKNLSKKTLLEIRKQLLTTIKCYDYLYQDKKAVIDIFDIPNDVEILKRLEKIKYLIRARYVLNTDKNFIKFLDLSKKELLKELKDIDIRKLNISHIRVNSDEIVDDIDYNLAYLNCIHISDPDEVSIGRDLDIIESSNVLTKKIKL